MFDRFLPSLKMAWPAAYLPEPFAELDLARSSYFYHRARLRVADKYGGVRLTIADIFELNSPLLRLSSDTGGTGQAEGVPLRKSRTALDEAGMLGRCR